MYVRPSPRSLIPPGRARRDGSPSSRAHVDPPCDALAYDFIKDGPIPLGTAFASATVRMRHAHRGRSSCVSPFSVLPVWSSPLRAEAEARRAAPRATPTLAPTPALAPAPARAPARAPVGAAVRPVEAADSGSSSGTAASGDSGAFPPAGNPDGSCKTLPLPSEAQLVDTSNPTTVVGTGTAASCTFDALNTAVTKGGIITFDCGSAPVTIPVTATLPPPDFERQCARPSRRHRRRQLGHPRRSKRGPHHVVGPRYLAHEHGHAHAAAHPADQRQDDPDGGDPGVPSFRRHFQYPVLDRVRRRPGRRAHTCRTAICA